MKVRVKQRDRRALMLLVLALVIYGGINIFVLPAYDRIATARDFAAEKETQLKKYRRAQLRKGQYTELLKTASARVAQAESLVISAGTLSVASSEFQSFIEGAASATGLTVTQRSIGTAKRLNDFYAQLPMTLSFDSTPGQLVSFLAQLRTLPRFVAVQTLQLSPLQSVMEAPKGQDLTKNVRVYMTIYTLASANIAKTPQGGK